VQHVCSHRCKVELMFGNVYRCLSSGQVHVCDQGCSQQVPQDRYSSVCRISKKVFHHAQPAVDASRCVCLQQLYLSSRMQVPALICCCLLAGRGPPAARTWYGISGSGALSMKAH
jgi:hypothetical protein